MFSNLNTAFSGMFFNWCPKKYVVIFISFDTKKYVVIFISFDIWHLSNYVYSFSLLAIKMPYDVELLWSLLSLFASNCLFCFILFICKQISSIHNIALSVFNHFPWLCICLFIAYLCLNVVGFDYVLLFSVHFCHLKRFPSFIFLVWVNKGILDHLSLYI